MPVLNLGTVFNLLRGEALMPLILHATLHQTISSVSNSHIAVQMLAITKRGEAYMARPGGVKPTARGVWTGKAWGVYH